MIQHVEDIFFAGPNPICKPLFPSQYSSNRVVKLKEGTNYFYSTEGLNPENKSSALIHYIQVKPKLQLQIYKETDLQIYSYLGFSTRIIWKFTILLKCIDSSR